MPMLSINLLGEFQLVLASQPLTDLYSPRIQSFLAYLVLHRGHPVPRQQLAFLLWPESSEAQARTNLRKLVHQVRKQVPAAERFVDLEARELEWREDAPFTVDTIEFESAIRRGGIDDLEQAVELYRGELLPNCYEDWIQPERDRLRKIFSDALERLTDLYEAQRNYRAAIGAAQRLLQHEPLREVTYRRLMRLYAQSGDRAAALKTFEECANVLKRELGVEPSQETLAAYQRLLKVERRGNLPKLVSSFVGREREIVETKKLLATTRILTLTGAGGVGKTRLSLQVAESISDEFSDGVWFVELASLTDPALVLQTTASALGVREETGRALSTSLTTFLRAKHLLLILDNCEHLVDACARMADTLLRACPDLTILATSREALGITGEIVFSVPPLSIPDLHALPALENFEHYESSRLFIARALSVMPSFAATHQNMGAIAQACYQLDGMPLAIELAAARVNVLPVEQIAARLDDRFRILSGGSRTALPRQQALRGSIDWSYDLLSPAEQLLFRRLSVFVGGWTLDAAEQVASDELHDTEIGLAPTKPVSSRLAREDLLDLLTRLVQKSLVVVDGTSSEARYSYLETIRAYAREKFGESDESAKITRAHAEYYRALAKDAEPHFFGKELESWLNRLEKERDNIRAALEWSKVTVEEDPDPAREPLRLGLHLAALLWRFWKVRGYSTEGREWLDALLAQRGALHTYERAYALHTAGNLASDQGDLSRAKEFYEGCLELSREQGNEHFIAHMSNNLGNIAIAYAQYDQAAALYSEALAHYRGVGWKWGVSTALQNLGTVAHALGKYDDARSLYEESMAMSKEGGDKERIAMMFHNLGRLADDLGRYDEAARWFQQALDLREQIGDQFGLPYTQRYLGKIALRQGDDARAKALFEESLAQFQKSGDKRGTAVALYSLGKLAQSKNEYAQAVKLYCETLALNKAIGDKRGILDCLEAIASLSMLHHDNELATTLLGAADGLRQAIRTPIPPSDLESHELAVNTLRAALDENTFNTSWSEGRKMTVESAIALALDLP